LKKFQSNVIEHALDWQANQRLSFTTVEELRKYPVKFPEPTGNVSVRVFALTDPRDGTVRWIGFTTRRDPSLPRKASPAVREWIRELQLCELTPGFIILDQVCPRWRAKATQSWLAYARNLGRLYNYSDQADRPPQSKGPVKPKNKNKMKRQKRPRGFIDKFGIYRRSAAIPAGPCRP
jgi:hypothetical protein